MTPPAPLRDGGGGKPPAYLRVVRLLTDSDIRDELRLGKGGDGFQAALRAEAAKRGLKL